MGALLVHKLPGRVRLRVPALKGSPNLVAEAEGRLLVFPGIKKVRANPVTGSLELLYDPVLIKDAAAPVISECRALFPGHDFSDLEHYLLGIWEEALPASYGVQLAHTFGAINQNIRKNLNGLDLAFLVPASLFGLGLYRLLSVSPKPLPRWFDLWWYGFSIFMMVNRPPSLPSKDRKDEPLK